MGARAPSGTRRQCHLAEPLPPDGARCEHTFVRRRGEHPARRRRLVLRVGRAEGRPAAARSSGDRRLVGRSRCELRGQGVRHPHRDERRAGAQAVPAGDRGRAALLGLQRSQQGDVPGLRRHDSRRRGHVDRRGVPRRARHAACLRDAARDRGAAAARRARAGRDPDHGRRRPDEVPRQGRERGGQARRPARRAARGRAGVPPSAPGRAPVGRRAGDRAQAPRARDRDGRPGRGAVGGRARAAARARPRAVTCTRSPTTATPGRSQIGRRRRSIGAQRALGRSPTSPAAIDAALVTLVDRVTRRMRTARRVGRTVVLRLRFDDFSRATRSHTLPRATAGTGTILAAARGLAGRRRAADRAPGPHPRGRGGDQPRRRARRPARPAVRSRCRGRARHGRSTRCARASGRARSRAPCCSAATRDIAMPLLPD